MILTPGRLAAKAAQARAAQGIKSSSSALSLPVGHGHIETKVMGEVESESCLPKMETE